MKKVIVVLVALLVLSTAVYANVQNKNFETAIHGYIKALHSENPGLRYNAVYQIAQLKSINPNADLSKCENCLKKIAKQDPNNLVRLHASLALLYLQDKNLALEIKMQYREEPTKFFNRLHQKVLSSFIAMNK